MPLQVKKVQLKLKDGNEYKDGDLLFNVDAEAWVRGTRNGQVVDAPVTPDSSYPHAENNAEYYAEQAGSSASAAAQAVLTGNLAPTFNTTTAYSKGDYVIYNGKLYYFTANHAAGAWDDSHVVEQTVQDSLENMIKVNDDAEAATKIQITTTNEDIDLITIQDFQNIVADEFVNNKVYSIGQYVLYEENLYKFITIHNAGNWNNNHVVQVKICNEINDLKTRLDNLEIIDTCNTLSANFAALYIADQAYAVGDYCTYQYKLYQCKTAIAANTDHTFNASHWDQVTITDTLNDEVGNLKESLIDEVDNLEESLMDEVGNLEEQLNDIVENVTDIIGIEGEEITDLGGYDIHLGSILSTGVWYNVADSGYQHIVIPIDNPGATLSVTAKSDQLVYLAGLRTYGTPVQSEPVDFSTADGWTQVWTISRGGYVNDKKIPDDVGFLYIQIRRSSNDVSPDAVDLIIPGTLGLIDETKTQLLAALSTETSRATAAEYAIAENLAAEVARAEAAENLKVGSPTTSGGAVDYGTIGQGLRTLGNGKTEWADFGLPTDEQTAEAVEAWLDEHPEATTSVPDHSLTNAKLVTGTLSYVTPEMYGAVGNGLVNDFAAFHAALYSGFPVFLEGTYLLSAATYDHASSFTFIDVLPDGAYLFGPGTIKFPDDAMAIAAAHDANRGLNLFYVNGHVTIRDITVDMNGANNTVAEGESKAYMHAFYGIFNGCYFENVTIKNTAGRSMIFLRDGAHNRFIGCHLSVGGTNLLGNVYQTDFSFVYCDAKYTDFIGCEIDGVYPPFNGCGGIEIHRDHCKVISCLIHNVKICVIFCMSDNRQGTESPLNDVVVDGNSLSGIRCVRFWQSTYPYADITVTNNNMHFASVEGLQDSAHGIQSGVLNGVALNVNHLVFTGNNIYTDDNTEDYAVLLKNITDGIISGNVIDTTGSGIYVDGEAVLVTGNTIKCGPSSQAVTVSGDNVLETNNLKVHGV